MNSVISSSQNERVKLVRALQTQAKARRKENRIVLEGVRLVADAVEAGVKLEFVLYNSESDLLARLFRANVPCFEVNDAIMREISDTQTPQGIIAVVPLPRATLPELPSLVLLLDAVADPGNLGTILRTAAAAAVEVVILLPGCVDPYNPKVLRSGMGAHFRLPISTLTWEQVSAHYPDLPMYVADAEGDLAYYEVDWQQAAGVIIGGEARGAREQAYAQARATITIPMGNQFESLNAAMATAVILFECRRQRAAGR